MPGNIAIRCCLVTVITLMVWRVSSQKVRIVGKYPREGRAQIKHNGEWWGICGFGWDTVSGNVMCRELGYPSAAMVSSVEGPYTKLAQKYNVHCTGREETMTACQLQEMKSDCDRANIVCQPAIRLVGSPAVVEIYDGAWERVAWNPSANVAVAKMMCRELGYPDLLDVSRENNTGWNSVVSLKCRNGSLNSFGDCNISMTTWTNVYLGISCSKDVRLVNKTLPNEGSIELYYHNEWRPLCYEHWTKPEGDVVCRSLGYTRSEKTSSCVRFIHYTVALKHNESCTGTEKSLRFCNGSDVLALSCYCSRVATVKCVSGVHLTNDDGGIGGREGMVAIEYEGKLQSVCSKDWDIIDANIVCRQLKFPKALRALSTSTVRRSTRGSRSLTSINCSGDETTLDSCSLKWGHPERCYIARVICERGIRLVGNDTQENSTTSGKCNKENCGKVELYNGTKSKWGVVLDRNWTSNDAKVACKQLGFPDVLNLSYVDPGNESIVLRNPTCRGSEEKLFECGKNTLPGPGVDRVGGVQCVVQGQELCNEVCSCSNGTADCSEKKIVDLPWVSDSFDKSWLKEYILANNELSQIWIKSFPFPELEKLDLSRNKIKELPLTLLHNTTKLKILNVSHNKLRSFSHVIFIRLSKLHTLDVSENRVPNWGFLDYLSNLKNLRTSYFTDCCFAKQKRANLHCESGENAFSDCKSLLRNHGIRMLIWFVLVLTLVGNIVVFISKFFVTDNNISQKLFIISLGVSDLLMGIYLTIIAVKDELWRGAYFEHDLHWRTSTTCLVAGRLSMISCQASLFTLIAITHDRFRSVTNAMKFKKIGVRMAVGIVVMIWLSSAALSIFPVLHRYYIEGEAYSGTNTVCLPLQLRVEEGSGWLYSFALFGIVNLIMSCYIVIAYIWMFVTIRKTSKDVRSENMKKEASLAKRMLCIVVTDLMSWFPVIIVIFLSFFDAFDDEKGVVFVYLAVCAIPINSAINPLLYTLTTPAVVKRISKLIGENEPASGTRPSYNTNETGGARGTTEM